ncbi:hypothetical protein A3A46_02800 [Candidatus Roizmanbacteria bacterium RIFCSPLOWO2_01_FULL_37_13]|uniref:Glycosyltransferase RgtA/B/C/D-like domain-containing protein n=1 Tax=Candidatus Roizmanbacteria bacterium RIFCSPHIGHO2_02_FULL_38_11 TaxID=1802039 RepID=A0A1F7H339_9BACT|nr:MAG: hypothetical protein A3C25_00120 [Candidatus Roizmanbacteria bacterium RIFCSPHIGHO2_02_FULL_38_11]OGK43054.1 MAG: hypothetical protein A3A46_02800 [Candidatus Roizmanbacteria bacterium RIFCSPLOWO2_01_FULL_37_13]
MLKKTTILFYLTLGIIVATISIFHVIIAYAKSPNGTIYLGTGHYYLDYYYYLTYIAQGLRGYFLPRQYLATDDPSIYYHLTPYILLGQLGRVFKLSPIAVYWISVFILLVMMTVIIFFIIRKLLDKKPFFVQLGAFLITSLMVPFYPYDFWASYSTFIKRFEMVPHHLIAHILLLLILLASADYLKKIEKRKLKEAIRVSLSIGFVLGLVLSFYPFQAVLFFASVELSSFFYLLKFIWQRKWKIVFNLLFFLTVLAGMVFISAILVRQVYFQTIFFQSTKGVEVGWREIIPLKTFLLSFGPGLVFSLIGLFWVKRLLNSLWVSFFSLAIVSFGLFYSNLDVLLGTHNGRFLTPVTHLILGSLAALGMYGIATFLKRLRMAAFLILLIIFIATSLPQNIRAFKERLNDKNLASPISYLPKGIIEGFKFLGKQRRSGNVLMTPSQFLGTVIPVFVDRKTYVARHSATPNYIEKNIRTSNFYLGAMSNEQALDFLKKNGLKFVVLTSIEGYDVKPLYIYPFLKEIYKNRDIVIFELIESA